MDLRLLIGLNHLLKIYAMNVPNYRLSLTKKDHATTFVEEWSINSAFAEDVFLYSITIWRLKVSSSEMMVSVDAIPGICWMQSLRICFMCSLLRA